MDADELAIGVAFFSGELLQGKIGLGYATVRKLEAGPTSDSPELDLRDVNRAFDEIATTSGAGSAARRTARLLDLFGKATADERHFLVRLIVGELRQGANEGIVLDAIARATSVSAASIRRATTLAGDARRVAQVAKASGEAGLAEFRIRPFTPLMPMLAQPATDVAEALASGKPLALEYKLDGARIQVHKVGDEVRIYTRSLHDVTDRLPEIVVAVRKMPVQSVVLDGEAIALTPEGRPLPFQTTMRRFGKQLDAAGLVEELPMTAVFFDCLHLDGTDLLDQGEADRFLALSRFTEPANRIVRAVVSDESGARAFLEEALQKGHEGVVAKAMDAPYEAGRRGAAWLKLKPAHTLDLVVLAVEWGSGRRKGLLSNVHLGARDGETGEFVMLGKTFKGMTDAMLRFQTEKLLSLEVSRDAYTVYVKPELVVEIAFDGVQESPQYPAGLALRFARVKGYREDKSATEADTIETVRAIFDASRSAGGST
jgi:DNA ligase-1